MAMPSMHHSMVQWPNIIKVGLPNFVKELDEKYFCIKCNDVLRPPVKQTECGHRMCEVCVERLFIENQLAPCPGGEADCFELSPVKINPDNATFKEMQRLDVYCTNKKLGCKSVVKWNVLLKHIDDCLHTLTECSNPGCGTQVMRSEKTNHELDDCHYIPMLCPHCQLNIPKNEMKDGHEEHCASIQRSCSLESLGCSFLGTSDDLRRHSELELQKHSLQIASEINKLKTEQKQVANRLTDLTVALESIKDSIGTHDNSGNKDQIQRMQSLLHKLEKENLAMKHQFENCVSNNVFKENTRKTQDVIEVAKNNESRITYLEQRKNDPHIPDNMLDKITGTEKTIGLHDIRMAEYDLRFRLLETASYDGRLIWRIPSYRRRKQDAIDGRTVSLYSQPFYSSHYGYKMCARVYLNGDGTGRGTHLSLFFVVMKGEYDAIQIWPFQQKVSLSVLDQSGNQRHITDTFRPDPTSSSFRQPVGEMNIASGSPMFALQSEVEDGRFLKNDTIFISVSIDTSDLPEQWH